MLITGSDIEGIQHLKQLPGQSFKMKDLGPTTYFLGLEVEFSPRGYVITQKKFTKHLLEFANLIDDKHVDTPMEVNAKFLKDDGE